MSPRNVEPGNSDESSVAVMKNKNDNKEFGTVWSRSGAGKGCGRPDIWGHISSGDICPFQTA